MALLLLLEDAKNLVRMEWKWSQASKWCEMRRKWNVRHDYGNVRLVSGTKGIVLKNVPDCNVWSDPRGPLMLTGDTQAPHIYKQYVLVSTSIADALVCG